MKREQIRSEFLHMIQPFVRNYNPDTITDGTLLVEDLNVNSARLVDIILEMEDKFSIRIDDAETEALTTVGSAVNLVVSKLGVADPHGHELPTSPAAH